MRSQPLRHRNHQSIAPINAVPYTEASVNPVCMNSRPQSDSVIQALRVGDLISHRQQPEKQYEVLTVVEKQQLLAARLPEPALRFIALGDVVVPF